MHAPTQRLPGLNGGARLSAMALALSMVFPSNAATLAWTNTSGTKLLGDAGNWGAAKAPAAADSLTFGILSSADYALLNNLSLPLNEVVFLGGDYTLAGTALTLSGSRTLNLSGETIASASLKASGGNQTITADIILQPLVINRVLSQQVLNQYSISAFDGASLTLAGAVSVTAPSLVPGLPVPAASATASTIYTSTGANSALGLGAVKADNLLINNAHTGVTTVKGALDVGKLSLSGSGTLAFKDGGKLAPSSSAALDVAAGAALVFDNSAAALNDRLGHAALTLNPSAKVSLLGNAHAAVVEQAGKLVVNGNIVQVTGGPVLNSAVSYRGGPDVNSNAAIVSVQANGQLTVLSFSELAFGTDSITPFGSNLYNYTFRSGGSVDFQTAGTLGGNERIVFTMAPGASSGLINNATVNSYEFAAYDASVSAGYARGVVSATTATTLGGAGAADNVYLNGASATLAGPATINSLALKDAGVSGSPLSLASGKLLLNGANTVAAGLNFGTRQGEIITKTGATTLQGALSGSNGLLVRGAGVLTLSGVSDLSGIVDVKSPTLVLAADNVLSNAALVLNGNLLDIGSTEQHVQSLAIGRVNGTGSLIATAGDLSVKGGLDATSLRADLGTVTVNNGDVSYFGPRNKVSSTIQARDVVLINTSAYGDITASASVTANYADLNGALAGSASLTTLGTSTLGAVSNLLGKATIVGDLTVWGAGALAATSAVDVNGVLRLSYDGSADRIKDSATVALINYGSLQLAQAAGSAITEHIGALTVSGSGNTLTLSGNISLLASSLSVQSGGRLYVDLGDSGTVKFLNSPVAVDGAAITGVLVNRTTASGSLPVWASYSSAAGIQTEHAAGTLATAGSGIVRVTSATNAAVNASLSVGGALFDTSNAVVGSGTLSSAGGLAFLQDNNLTVQNVVLGQDAILSNAGSNSIYSSLSGTSVSKLGSGTIYLKGDATFNNVEVGGGKLVVEGVLNASASNGAGTTDALTIRGAGRITGSIYGAVTLQNSAYTSLANQSIDTVYVLQGSSFHNQGWTNQAIAAGSAGISNTGSGVIQYATTESGLISNAGKIGSARTTSGTIGIYTGATIGNVDNVGGTVNNYGIVDSTSNGGIFNNYGTLGETNASLNNYKVLNNRGELTAAYLSNSGSIVNTGTVVLSADGIYTSAGQGSYVQNSGKTTIDGVFNGDITLNGGTLNGWGAITGTVTVANGASVLPGHSPGTLTVTDLVLQSGATLTLEISTSGAVSDKLIIDGSFTALSGSHILFNLIDNAGTDTDLLKTLNINDYLSFSTPPASDAFENVQFISKGTGNQTFYLTLDSSGVVGSVSAVPEADTWAMLLSGLGLLGWFGRRRQGAAARRA